MKVAIIGAGNVGKALTSSFTGAGHDVTIAAAHPENAQEAATTLGAHAARTNKQAVADADLVVLAIPVTALVSVARELGDELAGKTVVDVSNRPTPDPAGPGTSIAEELQEQLPKSRVVKAFNTLFASRQADPVVGGLRSTVSLPATTTRPRRRSSTRWRAWASGQSTPARSRPRARSKAWRELNISRNMAGGTWQDAYVIVGPDAEHATTN